MSYHYQYNKESIEEVANFMGTVTRELQDSYSKGVQLKSKIEGYSGWKGKQRDELIAFMDLLLQYHKDLIEGKDAPYRQYEAAFVELVQNIEGYKGSSPSYKELNRK